MCDNMNSNPFAGLFTSINDAVSFSSRNKPINDEEDHDNDNNQDRNPERDQDSTNGTLAPRETESKVIKENENENENEKEERKDLDVLNENVDQLPEPLRRLVGNVFGLTLRESNEDSAGRQLVLLENDSIEHAIFERLLLPDPKAKLLDPSNAEAPEVEYHFVETQAIPYLFESYRRLQRYQSDTSLQDVAESLTRIVLRNVGTALQEPDLFQGQEIHGQFLNLFMDFAMNRSEMGPFCEGIVTELIAQNQEAEEEVVTIAFSPVLDILHREIANSNLFAYRQYWFDVLETFAGYEPLARLLLRHSNPKSGDQTGKAYADTLLGALLSISCLPKTANAPFEYFDKPLKESHRTAEGNVWTALDVLSRSIFKVIQLLVKCSAEVRHLTLQWIGNCLHANADRGKLSNSQDDTGLGSLLLVSDGFLLNLGNVLLRLCQPFCDKDTRALKIDPTYCAAEPKDENESRARGLHIKGLSSETCLIPTPEDTEEEGRPTATNFGFVTECFFLTHKALELGFRVVLEKLLKTNQNLARIQRVYNDIQTDGNSDVVQGITQRLEMEMTKYLSLRVSLLVPEMLDLLAKFHAVTAFWLIQVYVNNAEVNENANEGRNYAPLTLKPVTFPLPETVPKTVRCIPEFVVENAIGFFCLRPFNSITFEEQGPNFLNPILTEIIVLMESPKRLYNPHLRARLAGALESLLPTTGDRSANPIPASSLGTFHRQQLFIQHPHRQQIVPSLLQVFVSIEMVGESIEFEEKFNYRHPMYVVASYLWKIPENRDIFKALAQEAEDNMEAVQPPLFLRFINLLINDAVYLLDDAFSKMAQLKQLLQARENGERVLPPGERLQQSDNLQQIGMIARFDNILGRETITTLKMLTTEIKSIFCHPTMVDRITSMLNYLLLQLVGPNKKNLKVKDQKEYEFNPANLVLNICEIYINLSSNESFTLAVSQDGRSYSPELFKLADNVLVRIGGVGILEELDQFAKKVEKAANQKREKDEILTDAPDEFMDPIMSTLMTDPVILPSSRVNIDRQTIARHLLSDQTDPFNRSPLTMEMVVSNTELRNKIQDWIEEKKRIKEESLS